MGRWKRNTRPYDRSNDRSSKSSSTNSKSTSTSSSDHDGSATTRDNNGFLPSAWTTKERKKILEFLKDYRRGCESVYEGVPPDASIVVPRTIGEVGFPALTEEVLRRPYLALPTELTSKQRRIVHESCVEAKIHHISIGESDKRQIVVSIYSDGFQRISPLLSKLTSASTESDQLLGNPHRYPLYKYRPWYCRRERFEPSQSSFDQGSATPQKSNSARRVDEQGIAAIESLIDQPGECIRDTLDDFNFERWENVDLSDINPPPLYQDSSWVLVDTPEKMRACVQELSKAKPAEIGFDLESLNKAKHTQLTCLLQITSDSGRDYVIDTLAPGVWDVVGELASLFADPSIVKVGHSIGSLDIRSLHRDFGILVVNAFDTYEAARALGIESLGLAAVCTYYGVRNSQDYVKLKNQYQKCDWTQRPLTPRMIQYGRYDVHFLLRLRWLMIRDLIRGDLWDKSKSENDAEARRVAASLAQTLAQFAKEEDGSDGENGLEEQEQEEDGSDYVTTLESQDDSEEEDFLTPLSSRSVNVSQVQLFSEESLLEESNNEVVQRNPVAEASVLRMQPRLMKVLSHSQQRCKDIWFGQEPYMMNDSFLLNLFHRAKKNEIVWTTSNTRLYEDLIQWRATTAAKLECLPGFVAPLEFLIPVAWHRPTCDATLRRILYQLPDLLVLEPHHKEELLTLVRKSIEADGKEPSTEDRVYRYEDYLERKTKLQMMALEKQSWSWRWKVVLAITIGAGMTFLVVAARRKRR